MSWPKKLVEWSFVALFVLVPLVFLPNTSELFEFPKMLIAYFMTGLIVFGWVSRCITEKRLIFRRTLLDIPILIFLISQFSSLIFSIDPRTSWLGYYSRFNGGFISLLSYSLLYWAFVSNMDRRSTLGTVKWALSTAALVAAWGFLEHFGIDDDIWIQDVAHRVFSTLGQPNWLAAYIVGIIFIPISLAFSEKNKNKLILFHSSTFLLFVVLLFTKSRSGLAAFSLSALVYWGLHFFKLGKLEIRSIRNFGIFVAVSLTLTLIISNPVRDTLFSKLNLGSSRSELSVPAQGTSLETGGTESGNIRKIVWTGAIRAWQENSKTFWLGTGPETFTMAYYQHRPIEHNNTSEWELLYNKAHNEFLNYLTTTGLTGLLSYILLLVVTGCIYIRAIRNPITNGNHFITISLFAGWLTIPITNFWGFSVVMVQILMFLLPAMAVTLISEDSPPPHKNNSLSFSQILLILTCTLSLLLLTYYLIKYLTADIKYAHGQNQLKAFTMTQDPKYILSSYQSYGTAYKLNSREPAIVSDYGNIVSYVSLLMEEQDATAAATMARAAAAASIKATQLSPHHPNHFKNLSRTYIILSTYHPEYLRLADEALAAAAVISPTDPKIPYNRGLIASFAQDPALASQFYKAALALKPDYNDPKVKLAEIATSSAQPQ